MGSIILHPQKGINPHLTVCQRCGQAYGIALLGNRDNRRICRCGCTNYGARGSDKCGKCGEQLFDAKVEPIREHEDLPGGLCTECEKEVTEHAKIVAEGGVYFRCAQCGRQGVIKANEFAAEVRKHLKTPTPKPCGVEFQKCEEHGGKPS